MRQVLFTDSGKKIVVDRNTDVCLYDADGNSVTRGRDLYAHKARSGNWYIYAYDWSRWQGESSEVVLLTHDEATIELFDLLKRGKIGESTIDRVSEMLGRDLFEEDA
jgi:hypothetical protein